MHLKDETRQFWDLNPCGTSESWAKARELRFKYTDAYLTAHLQGDLFRGKRVLEVGCGQGLDAAGIVESCASYTGIDLSERSLALARSALEAVAPAGVEYDFRQGDAENLDFPDSSFDVVYSIGVLHHTPGFEKAFAEIYRVLEPGGTLMLMLYRSYTPLWCVLRSVRGFLRIPWLGPALKRRVLESSRRRQSEAESESGTVILELFGCPLIDTYTLHGIRKRCQGKYRILHEECHRVGLEQVIRIAPKSMQRWWPQRLFDGLERRLGPWLGFYMLIVAQRNGPDLSTS